MRIFHFFPSWHEKSTEAEELFYTKYNLIGGELQIFFPWRDAYSLQLPLVIVINAISTPGGFPPGPPSYRLYSGISRSKRGRAPADSLNGITLFSFRRPATEALREGWIASVWRYTNFSTIFVKKLRQVG